MASKGTRGSYPKGIAKREEILSRALDVIAHKGLRGASVKELAEAVGLSQAGLLHYFDGKEALFTEILRKRDEVDSSTLGADADADAEQGVPYEDKSIGLRAAYLSTIRHNADVPGLVHLFAQLSVDATDPTHPAHQFFRTRGEGMRRCFASAIAAQQAAGQLDRRVDAETLARLLQAVSDGMQLQWMLEPDIDMAATVDGLFDLLAPPPPGPDDHAKPA